MGQELQGSFVNYYEILGVAEDAPSEKVRAALQIYSENQEARLNNQLSMTAARTAMNEVVPAIERTLLDDIARAQYNQRMAEYRKKQTEEYEPADNEGLDDALRIPFLFNPLDDFDTEIPGYTLRSIATKLDNEWLSACIWIADTTDEIHGFVSYLMFVANRKGLAKRIERIIDNVFLDGKTRATNKAQNPDNADEAQDLDDTNLDDTDEERDPDDADEEQEQVPLNINEAIERCIDILDPTMERPRASVYNATFDGKALDAGSFITDQPAQGELILGHDGIRGCAFGTVESRTNWLTFDNGQPSVHFALMPIGTEPEIGASEVKIPLHFAVSNLVRDTEHTAHLVLRMENQVRMVEQLIQVQIYIKPLPPRVVFAPEGTQWAPIQLATMRRGMPTQVITTVRNYGDEALIPLIARITTKDKEASAKPYELHANDEITLAVDTAQRAYGEKYTVAFDIEYVTADAKGPTTIYAQGEILPTVWQSMKRAKPVEERIGVGCVGGFVGLALLGFAAAQLAAHASLTWFVFLAIPAVFLLTMRGMASATVVHIQRAGNTTFSMGQVPLFLWAIPLVVGLALALFCMLVTTTASVLVAAVVGLLVGGALGFLANAAKAQNKS
jgi:hypothetical protein